MHVVYLPYSDDIRELRGDPQAVAPLELVQQARKVVKNFVIDDHWDTVPNPSLQVRFLCLFLSFFSITGAYVAIITRLAVATTTTGTRCRTRRCRYV
jgi:hypothetical protein